MARLKERDYAYVTTVRGMCRTCRDIVPARVFFRDGGVWQQALCPTCENQPALIAADRQWYVENVFAAFPDRAPLVGSHPPERGCPHDCGPCTWHASPCQLPVVSVTNACDMRCPICFTYNRSDRLYHMPIDEMRRTVDWVVEASGRVDLINITGGEPTQHPRLLDILTCCRRPEIGRVTMNSNGLRLAADPDLCERLAELEVHVVLSFNTFDTRASVLMHGCDVVERKLRALDNLTRAGVSVAMLNVMVRGVNEDAVGGILDLMRADDQILSLVVQTMTHTGQGGGGWPERAHLPVDEATRIVCEHSGGDLAFTDFAALPSAHPLCYLTCHMLKSADGFLPFARFADRDRIAGLMADSYLVRLKEDDALLRDAISELYARGETEQLAIFHDLVGRLFPAGRQPSDIERQRIAESVVRTVYVHTYMDEDNFDCSRAMLCPDMVPVEPGRLIPACTYNVFYRMQDERYYVDA